MNLRWLMSIPRARPSLSKRTSCALRRSGVSCLSNMAIIMRCLWMYVEKMQARYGTSQTLYRGMQGLWDEFQLEYQVGSCLEWCSFTSTSTSKDAALDLALGQYSGGNEFPKRPVLCVIQTKSRGAPLFSWSKYPDEDEVLLLPFQRIVVEDISAQDGILIKTAHPTSPQSTTCSLRKRGRALGIDISHRRFIAVYLSSFWEAIVKHPVRHPVSCLSEAMSLKLKHCLLIDGKGVQRCKECLALVLQYPPS